MCQSAEPSRFLSLPTQVSMSTVVRGVLTTNDWMREPRSFVPSSQKWGRSQRRWRATASAVESGSIDVVANDERGISTTGRTLTSPNVIGGMTLMAGQDTIECVAGAAAKTSGISSTFLGLLGTEPLAGSSVLDVGTGWGRLALELAPRSRRIVGLGRRGWLRWWDWRTSGGVTAAGSGTSSTWRRAGERSRAAI